MSEDGSVDGLKVGGTGELDLKGIKQGHKAGVQHVASPSRRPHGTHKLDVLHVLPVQLLATVIEALDKQIQAYQAVQDWAATRASCFCPLEGILEESTIETMWIGTRLTRGSLAHCHRCK